MSGVLYVVATPIGNLDDITKRALYILGEVDLICAEDTRTTDVLLKKYGIETKSVSYHKFNELEKSDFLIQKLISGENIALVSDAGTPLISDPGCVLVKNAVLNNIKIVPVGGISAVTTFLSSIPRVGEDFKFIGFLPKSEVKIEKILKNNKFENLVFYESPTRIVQTLEIILKLNFSTNVSVGRELTKKFEEIKTNSVDNILSYYKAHPPKGEIVCMVHKHDYIEEDVLKEKVLSLKKQGFTLKDTVSILQITDRASKNTVKEFFLNS